MGYYCLLFADILVYRLRLCARREIVRIQILCVILYMQENAEKSLLEKTIYIMKDLQMHIIPAEDVTWVYGINQTVTEYYGRREKHVRNHLYVSVHLKGEKEYKLQISEHNLKILMGAMREYPSIRLGYN